MNMISQLRRLILERGEATINIDDYNQLQAEWIKRVAPQSAAPAEPHFVTDEQLKETFDGVNFSQMVTADDLFYMIARAVLEKFASPPAPASAWQDIASAPTKSGRYIVAHRGHAVVCHYLANDKEWHPGSKLGWQKELNFGPTHYMPLQPLPPAPEKS